MTETKGLYSRALDRFRQEFMPINKGKTFTSEDVYRFFQLDKKPNGIEAKKAMGDVLYNLSKVNKTPELEQQGKHYRVIDRTLNLIRWWEAKSGDTLSIKFPKGVEDNTSFGFDDSIFVYPKDALVVAGEGNTAKTAFAINFLIENMDTFPCIYFTSEFNDVKFKDRMSYVNWVNIFKEDGTPKFQLAEHVKDWQDVIQPDSINIIDWIYLEDEMWKARGIMQNIIDKLNRGIALIIFQKRENKNYAEGGEGTKDLASVYLTIRRDKTTKKTILKADKVKTPKHGVDSLGNTILNPNYREWSFEIVNSGSKFCNITPVDK